MFLDGRVILTDIVFLEVSFPDFIAAALIRFI